MGSKRARLVNLPKDVKDDYRAQEIRFENMSTYISEEVKKGREEGWQEGRQEGLLEGEAIRQKEKFETAKVLLKQGVSVSIIQAATGLSIKEIEQLNR